jgi:hypothetical protein
VCMGTGPLCDGTVVNSQIDFFNCGGCDQPCASHEQCVGGACECPTDQPVCDDQCGFSSCTGGCADLQFDPANCGTCGHVCSSPGRTEGCLFGGCCGAGDDACDPSAPPENSNCCTGRCGTDGTCCSGILNRCNTPGVSGGDCCDATCGLEGTCCRMPGEPCTPGFHMCCTGECTPERVCSGTP